jgi:glucose-1-phosphate cytidylyltransferase
MKTVILAGGLGTRISEETDLKPKPMIEIGGLPILWHIMKIYSSYGFNEFVICLGYKGYLIKEYFANYFLHMTDVMIDIEKNQVEILNRKGEPWKITLIDTGLNTMTGGRIKQIQQYVNNQPFFLTYGDGLCNVNIKDLLAFHNSHNSALTVTAVQPPGRFGSMKVTENFNVTSFEEKIKGDGSWCNGGFFVCNPSVFKEITGASSIWEKEPMEKLAKKNEIVAFKHEDFWHPMDTLRDKNYLEQLWKADNAPWKTWKE